MTAPPMLYGLLDCNSFYASCERLFRPDLEGRPVAVLSNNDGCLIALSAETKMLGLKIGVPYFQCRKQLRDAGAAVFSANFSLYGDISARVMDCMRAHLSDVEVYSIDEAFFRLPARPGLAAEVARLRATVMRWCGVPVCVGVGPTRTLAKLANYIAKRHRSRAGVHILAAGDRAGSIEALELTPVKSVWGIGRNQARRLHEMGAQTALEFTRLPAYRIRAVMGVCGLRTQAELKGEPCFGPSFRPVRKSIIHSRTFPQRIASVDRMAAVVRMFVCSAAERMRRLRLRAKVVGLHVSTRAPGQNRRRSQDRIAELSAPTDDSWELMEAAERMLRSMHRPGNAYVRAGVAFYELTDRVQGDLAFEGERRAGRGELLREIDALNARYGRDTVRMGACSWKQKRLLLSPRYTTCRAEMMKVG